MAELEPAFLVAEFPNPEPMLAATKALREEGWQVELYTPFPVKGMKEALGFTDRTVPRAFVVGGLVGAVGGFLMQVYPNVVYPLDIGGRRAPRSPLPSPTARRLDRRVRASVRRARRCPADGRRQRGSSDR